MSSFDLKEEFNNKYYIDAIFRKKVKELILVYILEDKDLKEEYSSIKGRFIKENRRNLFEKLYVENENFRKDLSLFKPMQFKSVKQKLCVYVITNPAYPGYVKIGKTIGIERRLANYNTCSPFKDYKVEFIIETELADNVENSFKLKYKSKTEWYEIEVKLAIEEIKLILSLKPA